MDALQALEVLLQQLQQLLQEEEARLELLLLDSNHHTALLEWGRRKEQIEKYISILRQLQQDWGVYQTQGEWPTW